jgi:hypothetical protein
MPKAPENFDDYLHKLGQDYTLAPRDGVWPRIETTLDDTKKRRVALWWWIVPLLLLTGGLLGWLRWQNTAGKSTAQHYSKPNASAAVAGPTNGLPTPDAGQTAATNANSMPAKPEPILENGEKDVAKMTAKPPAKSTSPKEILGLEKTATATDNLAARQTAQGNGRSREKLTGSEEPLLTNQTASANQTQADTIAPTPPTASAAKPLPKIGNTATLPELCSADTPTTTISATVPPMKLPTDSLNKPTAAAAATPKTATGGKNGKPKVLWHAVTGLGLANVTDGGGLLNFAKASEQRVASNFNNGTGGVAIPLKSNAPGGGVVAGVQRTQIIGRRWQWVSILHYAFAQSKQQIGNRIDSTLVSGGFSSPYFYAGGNTTYTATQHALKLGSGMAFKLLGKQNALWLEAEPYIGLNLFGNLLMPDAANQRLLPAKARYPVANAGLGWGLKWQANSKWQMALVNRNDWVAAFEPLNGSKQYWRSWTLQWHLTLNK